MWAFVASLCRFAGRENSALVHSRTVWMNKWIENEGGGGQGGWMVPLDIIGSIAVDYYSCVAACWSDVMYARGSLKETIVGDGELKQTNVMGCMCCSQCCHSALMLNWVLRSSLHTDELLIRDELGMKSHSNMYMHCQYMEALTVNSFGAQINSSLFLFLASFLC